MGRRSLKRPHKSLILFVFTCRGSRFLSNTGHPELASRFHPNDLFSFFAFAMTADSHWVVSAKGIPSDIYDIPGWNGFQNALNPSQIAPWSFTVVPSWPENGVDPYLEGYWAISSKDQFRILNGTPTPPTQIFESNEKRHLLLLNVNESVVGDEYERNTK